MPSFLTPNRHPYSARFSPHHPNLIAVAASQYYGLAGGGSLYILELDDLFNVALIERNKYEWSDGLFDVVSIGTLLELIELKLNIISFYQLGLVHTMFQHRSVGLWGWQCPTVEHRRGPKAETDPCVQRTLARDLQCQLVPNQSKHLPNLQLGQDN